MKLQSDKIIDLYKYENLDISFRFMIEKSCYNRVVNFYSIIVFIEWVKYIFLFYSTIAKLNKIATKYNNSEKKDKDWDLL